MTNIYYNLILQSKRLLAQIAGGGYSFTIGRPNYSAINNTPVTISSGVQFYIQPSTDALGEDRIPGVNYMILTGDFTSYLPGDVITCTSADIPTVTVLFNPLEQEPLAMKSPKLATLNRNGTDTYTNVYFDYINVGGYKGTEDLGPRIPQVLEVSDRQAIIYNRPNLREDDTFTDNATQVPWSIVKIDYLEKVALLTLGEPSRG